MSSSPKIIVLGSVHMDLIASADRLPGRGESVSGGTFSWSEGGKAGNQASMLAALGIQTSIIARLGADQFGNHLLASLQQRGVETSFVSIDPINPTGASTILVAEGDYLSIIAPGASAQLSEEDVDRARGEIEASDLLILQFELPLAITAYAAQLASASHTKVVLNASPIPDLIGEDALTILRSASILIVNQVEAHRLLAIESNSLNHFVLARQLGDRFEIDTVIVTLGAAGSVAYDRTIGVVTQPAFPVDIVDTVGAGDAFLAAVCASLAKGSQLPAAMRRGAVCGALLVSRTGMSGTLPKEAEIDRFLTG